MIPGDEAAVPFDPAAPGPTGGPDSPPWLHG